MQALNYPAAAARGLRRFIDLSKASDPHGEFARDIDSVERMYALLTSDACVHFQLPEGGRIFNDKLKGIQGKPVKLPYRLISVSYRCNDNELEGNTFDGSKLIYVPKRVAIAIEIPGEKIPGFAKDTFPGCERICMIMAAFCRNDLWAPCHSMVIVPTDKWDGTGYDGPTHNPPTFMAEPGGTAYMGRVCVGLPGYFARLSKAYGREWARRSAMYDIGGEGAAVLELCEALTCSNVHESVIQRAKPSINERRIHDGKLPLWETKTLTIDLPVTRREPAPWQGGTHATPRLHLCRGHIRSLPGGKGNIWIDDYARGDPTKGTIKKTYAVRT